jgi:hypothetical protein
MYSADNLQGCQAVSRQRQVVTHSVLILIFQTFERFKLSK